MSDQRAAFRTIFAKYGIAEKIRDQIFDELKAALSQRAPISDAEILQHALRYGVMASPLLHGSEHAFKSSDMRILEFSRTLLAAQRDAPSDKDAAIAARAKEGEA